MSASLTITTGVHDDTGSPFVINEPSQDISIEAPIFCRGKIIIHGRTVGVSHIVASHTGVEIYAAEQITIYGKKIWSNTPVILESETDDVVLLNSICDSDWIDFSVLQFFGSAPNILNFIHHNPVLFQQSERNSSSDTEQEPQEPPS